jgi:hypothetical protein
LLGVGVERIEHWECVCEELLASFVRFNFRASAGVLLSGGVSVVFWKPGMQVCSSRPVVVVS